MIRPVAKSPYMDGAAVMLSAICLLHCLALPLFVAGLPMLAQFTESHLHMQMLLVIVPVSVVALGLGFRHHQQKRVLWLGAAGLGVLFLGATVVHNYYGENPDRIVTVLGSVVLAAAHYLNYKGTRAPVPNPA